MEKFKIFQFEALFDFFLMVLGVAIIIISLAYGFGSFRRPGPGLYSFFIGVCILVFSTALLISKFSSPMSAPLFDREDVKRFLLMIATFCLWIIVMPFLGNM